MFSRILSTTAVVLATTQLVSAQTHTDCNPTLKKCADDVALGSTVTVDFTKGVNDFFAVADGTTLTYDNSLGAVFTIGKESDAPTIVSGKYIFFGKIDITLRASTGTGIVTSFVLQSDDLDEIDWEWLGGDGTQVQTNYFGKGDTTTYDRGAYHPVSDPQGDFHTYTIDWTKDYVKWYIDGSLVRTLNYADAKGGSRFPQTPMQIKLGTWVAGGKDSPTGTVQWAGGYTDFTQAPFLAYYKTITIQDYSNGVEGAKAYSWNDGSDGSYSSITVLTNDSDVNSSTTSTTTTSAAGSSQTSTVTSEGDSSTKSGEDSTKTTLSTMTTTDIGGLTQATNGVDVDTTASVSAGQTIAISSSGTFAATTSGATKSAATSAPAGSGAFKQGLEWSSMVIMGASLFLGFLVM
ncbi:allergen rasp f9-like protein [Xylariales sp. AK1849]|nr:allergen rasp f9-like protein [Xylariales sp. AK1849]